jgi:hypothetical protein
MMSTSLMLAAFCVAPIGAVANDGIDDAPAIQAELAIRNVCLPAGEYTLAKHGQWSIDVPANRTLSGVGADTLLVMDGDGGFGAWSGINVRASNVTVRDLAITNRSRRTEEQTHTLQVRGPADDVVVERVWLSNPVRTCTPGIDDCPASGQWKGGDCIRTYGEDGARLRRPRLVGIAFRHCDRSGWSSNRGVEDASLTGSSFHDTGDQDIDIEATGTGAVDGIVIANNTFSGGQQGDYAISVQCSSVCRDVVIVGNVLRNRGIWAFNTEGLVVTSNRIRHTAIGIDPTILLLKTNADAVVASNSVTRSGAAGPVFAVKDHNTGSARNIAIRGNTVRQATSGPVFHYRGARGVTVAENRVHRDVDGIMTQAETSTNTASFDILVEANQLSGLFSALASGPIAALAALRGGQIGAP